MRRMLRVVLLSVLVGAFGLPLFGGVAGAAPVAPTLVSPNDNAGVKENPVLKWNAVPGAVRYYVQISAQPDFSGNHLYNENTVSLQATPTTDLPQATLYWRVRARDAANVDGPWSTRQFTKETAPSPKMISPGDNTTWEYPTSAPVFSWEPAETGAPPKSYTLEVDDDPLFVPPLVVNINTVNTSHALESPQTMGQTYYWRVKSRSANNIDSQYSEPRHYTWSWGPANAPFKPEILRPAPNNNDFSVESLEYAWTPVPGAVSYDLQVSGDLDFSGAKFIDLSNLKSTRYTHPTTLLNQSYYMRVRAKNSAGAVGAWSGVRTFRKAWPATEGSTTPADFDRVELMNPVNGATVTTPTFEYTSTRRASRYQIDVSPNSNMANPMSCTTTQTIFTPYVDGRDQVSSLTTSPEGGCDFGQMKPGTTYYWRVRPFDGSNNSTWVTGIPSEISSFRYQPASPTLLAPTSGTTTFAPVLAWSMVDGSHSTSPSGEVFAREGFGRYRATITNGATTKTQDTYTTSWAPEGLAPGSYTWYVQTLDNSGRLGVPSSSRSIVIAPAASGASVSPAMVRNSSPYAAVRPLRLPLVTWSPVTDATYTVSYGTGGGSYANLATGLRVPAYSHPEIMGAGTYTVRVQAIVENAVVSTTTVQATVTGLNAGNGGILQLLAPENCNDETCIIYNTPTFKWAPVPGATSYEVTLSGDRRWTNVLARYRTQFPVFTPRESYNDSQAGEGRYWYVRACFGNVCGPTGDNWGEIIEGSPVFSVRKQSRAIEHAWVEGVPNASNTSQQPNQLTFMWKDWLSTNVDGLAKAPGSNNDGPSENYDDNRRIMEARMYQVEVSTQSDFSTITASSGPIDETWWTPWDRTLPEGPIYWRVRAFDGSNNGLTWSARFDASKKTPTLTLKSPINDANADNPSNPITNTPVFQADPQNFAATYEIEVYKNVGSPLSSTNRVLTKTSRMPAMTFTTALPKGHYGWRMRRLDADNRAGAWTAESNLTLWKFTVQGAVPDLLEPDSAAHIPAGGPLFRWSSVLGAARYRIETSTSPTFDSRIDDKTTVMTAWAPMVAYPGNTTYYWRVSTLDGNDQVKGVSAVGSFGSAGLPYHPVTPARVLDTRPGPGKVGPFSTPFVGGQERTVQVAGVGGSGVPGNAGAVALNVTVASTTASGFLAIWPANQQRPTVSSINWDANEVKPNAVTVKVSNSNVKVFINAGNADVIIDVVGYYDATAGDGLTAITPKRIQDSRPGGPPVGDYNTPWGINTTRTVKVHGQGSVPNTATAVVLNATVTDTSESGYLTVFPTGATKPTASNLNWTPKQTVSNAVTVKVGTGGTISVYNAFGNTHVILDVVGYFTAGSGGLFHPLDPSRVLESRPGAGNTGGYSTPWQQGQTRDVKVTAVGGVDAKATAVLLNGTVTGGTSGSFLKVWPKADPEPNTSAIGWAPGKTMSNALTVKPGTGGQVSVYNLAGTVDVLMDVAGYYK